MARSPRPRRILLTGFEPFGGEVVNPSWLVAQALHGQTIGHGARQAQVVAVQIPCVFGQALASLRQAVNQHRPVLVLALGQAGGRADMTVERVAINVDDARIPDNAGASPIDEPVLRGAPVAYFSSLPIKAMVAAMRDAGAPASVSQTAGTFVCNHLFFSLMHLLRRRKNVRGGFMHVPWLPEQAAAQACLPGQPAPPSLGLQQQIEAVRHALAAALDATSDLRLGGGAVA